MIVHAIYFFAGAACAVFIPKFAAWVRATSIKVADWAKGLRAGK